MRVIVVSGDIVPTMKLTPEKLTAFCAALAETCNVGKACAAVGISRVTAYEWRDNDPDFAARWDQAKRVGVTALEDEAHRRAFEGNPEPVVHQGEFAYAIEVARGEDGEIQRHDDGTPKMRRALNPDGSPKLATIRKYSDTLAIFLLKAHDPKYRDSSKLELAGSLDLRNVPDEDLEAEIAALAAQVGHTALASGTELVDAPASDDASDLV